MTNSLEGKVILITGGSGFLGKQFSAFLETQKSIVVNLDRQETEWIVDISNKDSVTTVVKRVVERFGAIHGLVHAAALNAAPGTSDKHFTPYESFDLDLWRREIEINLTGMQVVTQAVAPFLMEQKNGSIVFIASDLAVIAPNNTIYDEGKFKDIAYVTSKAGVLGLMRSWASYLGSYGVRCNALVPGGMYNNQPDSFVQKNAQLNMLGRMAKKDEYNGPVSFLLSDDSSYMTGALLVVDGGRTAW